MQNAYLPEGWSEILIKSGISRLPFLLVLKNQQKSLIFPQISSKSSSLFESVWLSVILAEVRS